MTMTSTGPRPFSSFSPSCSCSAVKMFGALGSAGGSGTWFEHGGRGTNLDAGSHGLPAVAPAKAGRRDRQRHDPRRLCGCRGHQRRVQPHRSERRVEVASRRQCHDRPDAGACCHWTRLPAAANAANGTRNLTEAANHRPYRTRARLRRNASARSATTAANNVDCHRWLNSSTVISRLLLPARCADVHYGARHSKLAASFGSPRPE